MFLEFQTNGGPLFVNADKIVSYQHDDGREYTVLQTSDGGMFAVLEHPYMITKALETHTCVVRVLELQVAPQQEPELLRGRSFDKVTIDEDVVDSKPVHVTVRDGDGYVLGQWETHDRGHHTPS
jgi:hypothetical protein